MTDAELDCLETEAEGSCQCDTFDVFRLIAEVRRLRAWNRRLRLACEGAAESERVNLGPSRHPAMTELLRELEAALDETGGDRS